MKIIIFIIECDYRYVKFLFEWFAVSPQLPLVREKVQQQ